MTRSFYVAYSYKLVDKFSKNAAVINASVKRLNKSLGRLRDRTVKGSERLKGFGEKMKSNLRAPVLVATASLFLFNRRFSNAMNTLQADSGILDNTGAKFIEMRELAKELGSTTQFSASEAAQGMRFLAKAGLKTDEVIKAIPHSLNLAAAGGLELGEAADIATNIMSAFTLSVEDLSHVNDVLAHTASNSNTNIREMANAIVYAGGVSNAAGIKIEETSAFLATLAGNGLKGSIAGVSLKESINGLLTPSTKAISVFKKLGIVASDISEDGGRTIKDFTGIMTRLAEANLTAADKNSIFGERGTRVINAFVAKMKTSKTFTKDMREELEKVDGASKRMAKTRMQGLPGALKEAISAFEGMNLAVGDEGLNGIFINILKTSAKFFRGITNGSPFIKKMMIATLAATAALAFLVPTLITVGIAVQFVTWPITLITLGIIALIVAIVAVIAYWKEIVAWLKKFRNQILFVLGPIGWLIRAGGLLVKAWKPFRSMLKSIAELLDKVVVGISNAMGKFKSFASSKLASLGNTVTFGLLNKEAPTMPSRPYNITNMTEALINRTPMTGADNRLNGTINISAPPGVVDNAELNMDIPGNLGFNMSGAGAF